MSPDRVQNEDLYHDRTFQDWHRATFPKDHWAFDLDLFGACKWCKEPLWLAESTTNPNKSTTVLHALARRANVHGFLVLHDRSTLLLARVVWSPTLRRGTEIKSQKQIEATLWAIRFLHDAKQHR